MYVPLKIRPVCFLCAMFYSEVFAFLDSKNDGTNLQRLDLLQNDYYCNVTIKENGLAGILQEMLTESENIIFFDASIDDQRDFVKNITSEIYLPFNWIRVRGRRGEGLLWLREEFEMLSLSTLNVGVDHLKLTLKVSPVGCLQYRSITNISTTVRDLIFKDLKSNTQKPVGSSWNDGERLCNKRMRNMNGYASEFYHCCSIEKSGIIHCSELQRDSYIDILLWCIVILNIGVMMYAPWFVPERLYRTRNGFLEYEHKLKAKTSIRIKKIRSTKGMKKPESIIKFSAFQKMPKFQHMVESLKDDVGYELPIDTLNFKVKVDKLISENHVPVGIVKSLFNNFVLCQIRKNPVFQACCRSNVFGPCCHLFRNYYISWYQVLKQVMIGVLVFVFVLPWAVRVWVFFCYEEENKKVVRLAAAERGLVVTYPGSVTLLLTPVHIIFLVCYVVLFLDGVFVGILRKKIAEKFKYSLRKCLRDMSEQTGFDRLSWAFAVLLKPFEKLGVLGLVAAPFYWLVSAPIIICVLLFYCFPTVNITFRLFINLVMYFIPKGTCENCSYKKKQSGRKTPLHDILELVNMLETEGDERPELVNCCISFLQLLITLLTITSMYAIIFILLECLTFFVEVVVYTSIGVILNANSLMKYVSLLFMLVLYAKDCFGSVSKKYLLFNKTLMSAVKEKILDGLSQVSCQSEEETKNTAFQVQSVIPNTHASSTHTENAGPCSLVVSDTLLKWRIERVILFINTDDVPFIPEKFFFDASYMACDGCPGPLVKNLLKATRSFMIIIIFLLFVSLVVVAFGDIYNVSSANQTLATLAGGFLPFVFTKVLFKPPPDITISTSNVHFQDCINKVIHNFRQSWPVTDVTLMKESNVVSNSTENGDTKTAELDEIVLNQHTALNSCMREVDSSGKFDLIIDVRSNKTQTV